MQSQSPAVSATVPDSVVGSGGLTSPARTATPVPAYSSGIAGPARAESAGSLDDIFKPRGLQKYDPQGYGLKMAGSALKGLAKTLIAEENGPIDRTPRRLEISEAGQQRRDSRFDLSRFLSSLGNGGL